MVRSLHPTISSHNIIFKYYRTFTRMTRPHPPTNALLRLQSVHQQNQATQNISITSPCSLQNLKSTLKTATTKAGCSEIFKHS